MRMDIAAYLKQNDLTQEEFAAKVGVTQGRVSHWLRGDKIPAERCTDIERITGGAITRQELRPDVFGEVSTEARAA